MRLLSGSDALIIDLRDNDGGSPTMIQLLASYLLAEPTHVDSFYVRETGETQQLWTQAHVAGPRLGEVPVWILTSPRTFSAAEGFAYSLKHLERATLVGETTAGGAHPVVLRPLEGYPVAVLLPYGRAVNPVTGSNWQGTGVEPHRAVAAGDALDVAYGEALRAVAERSTDGEHQAYVAFLADSVELRRAGVALDAEALAAYAGTYGPRQIVFADGELRYRRGDTGALRTLTPVGGDQFLLPDVNDFRLRFERDGSGQVVGLVGVYADGREEPSAKS